MNHIRMWKQVFTCTCTTHTSSVSVLGGEGGKEGGVVIEGVKLIPCRCDLCGASLISKWKKGNASIVKHSLTIFP